MRRILMCVLLFVLVAGAAAAQDADRANGVKLDLSTQFTASVFAAHWSVNPSAVYTFGPLGVGAGIKTYFGLGHEALYLGPYARLELGWLYFGAGPLVLFEQPSGSDWATLSDSVSFIGLAGFEIPLVELGPGHLGIDTGVDIAITPAPVFDPEADNIFAQIIGAIAGTVAHAVVNSIKANVGIVYTMRL